MGGRRRQKKDKRSQEGAGLSKSRVTAAKREEDLRAQGVEEAR